MKHIKKVVKEKEKLDVKITNLEAFIKSAAFENIVSWEEQQRLKKQFRYMQQYSGVLQERIDAVLPVEERGKEESTVDGEK